MSTLLLLAGLILLAFTLFDIIITTLTTRGAGPLAGRLMDGLWGLLCAVQRRRDSGHGVLSGGGTAIVLSVVLVWVALLWAAWAMVFLSVPGAVVGSLTAEPADAVSVIYFAGFTLFTLGLGDYVPAAGIWQILAALCSGNGLLTLTLSATYLVPVASAAAEKRHLAGVVHTLGATPAGILLRHWNGRDFAQLEAPLNDLSAMIVLQAQQFLAYPALHYFHSSDPRTSLSLRLVALDEALTVLRHAVPQRHRPPDAVMARTHAAVDMFLTGARVTPTADPAPPPDVALLVEVGVPVNLDALRALPTETQEHRRRLGGLLRKDHWAWQDIRLEGS